MESEKRSQKIAVTGATGRVGSPLVEGLEQRGHEVVPIARSEGIDVVSGEGLDAALAGVDTIIDTATGPSPDQEEATKFFTTSARNLERAGAKAGVRGIVVVTIIGIDKFQGSYNAAKLGQEQALLEGPLPVRIVRAAQFHEFSINGLCAGRRAAEPGREARRPYLRRVAGVDRHRDAC